jgi:hypothetical protein
MPFVIVLIIVVVAVIVAIGLRRTVTNLVSRLAVDAPLRLSSERWRAS